MKYKDTYLSKEDVKQAYMTSSAMSSFDQMLDVLYKEISEIIVFNKEKERNSDVEKWINQEKKNREKEQYNAKKHNDDLDDREKAGEYVDINDYWIISPPPTSISYSGTTVCGWCLGKKEEPKGDCFSHCWDKE